MPTRPEGLTAVLAQPGVSEQVAATGVRYIVWLDGGTRRPMAAAASPVAPRPGRPAASASAGGKRKPSTRPPSGICKQAKSVGSVGTEVTGTSAVVGLIVPLPFIARVEGTACDRLGEQLRSFLAGTPAGAG